MVVKVKELSRGADGGYGKEDIFTVKLIIGDRTGTGDKCPSSTGKYYCTVPAIVISNGEM